MSAINLYWNQMAEKLHKLHEHGYVKLDPMPLGLVDNYCGKIESEMSGTAFKELGIAHSNMLKDFGIHSHLAPKLFTFAREHFGYEGALENQYHVARLIRGHDSPEAYRTHFDSHLFTLVMPFNIPETFNHEDSGGLYFIPKARRKRGGEMANILQKIYFKKYSGRAGHKAMSMRDRYTIESFADMRPLLFVGNTTLHGNFPLAISQAGSRLTVLAHFFDPAGGLGIGKVLRHLRSR
ncbi:hypothetical protein N9D28_02160 [Luminiphilus sp.]|nr:hypothetical protein [Luminiphilus sp.]